MLYFLLGFLFLLFCVVAVIAFTRDYSRATALKNNQSYYLDANHVWRDARTEEPIHFQIINELGHLVDGSYDGRIIYRDYTLEAFNLAKKEYDETVARCAKTTRENYERACKEQIYCYEKLSAIFTEKRDDKKGPQYSMEVTKTLLRCEDNQELIEQEISVGYHEEDVIRVLTDALSGLIVRASFEAEYRYQYQIVDYNYYIIHHGEYWKNAGLDEDSAWEYAQKVGAYLNYPYGDSPQRR